MPPPTTGASRSRLRGWGAAKNETRRRRERFRRRPYAQCKNGGVISTSAVDTYIHSNSRRFFDELKELCSFPSIPNHGLFPAKPPRALLSHPRARSPNPAATL